MKLDKSLIKDLALKCKLIKDKSDQQSRKFKIDEANNGLQAFEMFKKCHENGCDNNLCTNRGYKFIIMDLQMPVMDGFDASEAILKYQKDNNLKSTCSIVALTSFSTQETIERCSQIGLKRVYNKPADPNDITEMILQYYYNFSPFECKLFQ